MGGCVTVIPPAAAVAGIETVDEGRFEPEPEAEAEPDREADACDDDIVSEESG